MALLVRCCWLQGLPWLLECLSHSGVPRAPPAMQTAAASCSLPRLLLLQVWRCWLLTPSGGPRRVRAGKELSKSFPSKQDPYLAAACVGRHRAEGLVPPPRGLARLQQGGTRVLPAERWGCPAAGRAHSTQLCPQPSVRLSRNGGSLHGWGMASRADSYPRPWPNPGGEGLGCCIQHLGCLCWALPLHPEGERGWIFGLQLFNFLTLQ